MKFSGTYRAIVVDNVDPEGMRRVRVQIPQLLGGATSGWAYPVPVDATVPAVGAQVWVAFEGGDPSFPVYYASAVTTAYVDAQDAATLASAEAYANAQDASTLAAAESYADTHDATTLTTAESYADTQDAAHVAAADPHPQYLTSAEGNAAYVGLTGAQSVAGVKTFTDGIAVPAGDLPQSAISGLAAALPPTGSLVMYGAAVAPSGWLLCDGSAVSRTTYSALFGVIGTTFGTGDGSTTFNLPNLKGKVVVGFDAAQTEFNALGGTGGEKAHTLTTSEIPSHTHSISHTHTTPSTATGNQSASHTHDLAHTHDTNTAMTAGVNTTDSSVVGSPAVLDGGQTSGQTSSTIFGTSNNHTHTLAAGTASGSQSASHSHTLPAMTTDSQSTSTSGTAGTGGAHNNLQPYLVLNYVIKT